MADSLVFKNDQCEWQKMPWSDQADNAIGDLIADGREAIISDIESGKADLWKLNYSDGSGGWLLTRIDIDSAGGKELVLMAGRGEGMAQAVETLKIGCRACGIASIRAHSHRDGYERLVGAMGFEYVESVYRCELK